MNQNTYTVKEIAFFTGLSEAKIRTLIKDGTIVAELVNTVNNTGRKVKRLEVAEEKLAAFAFAYPKLAGPLADMEIVRNYAPKKVEESMEETSDELDVVEPNSEVDEMANDGWGPAEFTNDDVTSNDDVDENNCILIPDTPAIIVDDVTDEKNEESLKSEKEEILASLRSIEKSITDTIGCINNKLKYYSNIVEQLTSKSAEFGKQLGDIERTIKHIEEHM